MIKLVVEGECVPKGRPRFTRNGRAYTPSKTKEYEKLVANSAKKLGVEIVESAIKVDLTIYKGVPKSYTKSKRSKCLKNEVLPKVKPDLDNYIKSVLDGLNGVVFRDDNQICELMARKKYSDRPRVELIIEKME